MARFPFQPQGKYSVTMKNGGQFNFEYIDRDVQHNVVTDCMYNVVTGCMFAIQHNPLVYIDESEISSAVVIPQQDIDNLLEMAAAQRKQWEEHIERTKQGMVAEMPQMDYM